MSVNISQGGFIAGHFFLGGSSETLWLCFAPALYMRHTPKDAPAHKPAPPGWGGIRTWRMAHRRVGRKDSVALLSATLGEEEGERGRAQLPHVGRDDPRFARGGRGADRGKGCVDGGRNAQEKGWGGKKRLGAS